MNLEDLTKENSHVLVKLEIINDGNRIVGVPLSFLTEQQTDKDIWVLPNGLQLDLVGLHVHNVRRDPETFEEKKDTRILLSNLERIQQDIEQRKDW